MSATEGLKIGKVIFNILSNDSQVSSKITDSKIQPAPLMEQGDVSLAVTYQINSVNPVNIKRYFFRSETAPLYVVDFSLEIISKDYGESITFSDACAQALQQANNGTYNGVKISGITLESANEDYNKARRYYSKDLSFQARVLL
jgi:hypothetical protein